MTAREMTGLSRSFVLAAHGTPFAACFFPTPAFTHIEPRLLYIFFSLLLYLSSPCTWEYHVLAFGSFWVAVAQPHRLTAATAALSLSHTQTQTSRRKALTMGIVSNLTVYALMVLPIAMMLRGHSIHFSRLLKLAMTCLVVQLAESLLISAAPTSRAMITTVHGLIMPVIQTAFFTFAMHDHKALKIFRLRDGGDGDVAAVLSTTWCLTYTVLYRWIGWYRTASSLGYEMDNIISAADAFLTLVGALAAARHIQGGSEESTSTARLSASLAIILGSALAGTVVSLMVPAMPLVGAAVTTTLLVVAPKAAADDTKKGN